MPFPLALHCWLFAPDSDTRNRFDDVCETAQSYDGSGIGFYGSEYQPYSVSVGHLGQQFNKVRGIIVTGFLG